MIRTRDLLLFLLCAGFLLVAIGVTSVSQWFGESSDTIDLPEVASEGPDMAAAEVTPLDRTARILELQKKLAARGDVIMAAPVSDDSVSISEESEEPVSEDEQSTAAGTITTCASYTAANIAWPVGGLDTEEREGRRLYITSETTQVPVSVGSTTIMQTDVVERIWLHLPVRTSAHPNTTCIPYDVVGVALDGSLLRNNEHGIYSVFSSDTLIGYALDGLPIYGLNTTIATDSCGGAVVSGQYRYYLSSERDGVLGCFAAAPVQL